MNLSYSFLAIGKTKESTEGSDFKRYIGLGSSYVLAVNPTKAKLDELLGYETQSEPEYTGSDDNGRFARVTFVVRTDPKVSDGIEITNRVTFTLRPTPAYNRDQTKVQVIDDYGNTSWTSVDDAKAGKKLLSSAGNPLKIADKYRMACVGEPDLVAFLKTYLNVGDAFTYKNGVYSLRPDASDCVFGLEHIKDYFNGDFSELQEALKLQPNNKVKLLYGVRTTEEGRQYQTIATRNGFVLHNSASPSAITKLEKDLFNAKQAGMFATTEFRIQPLQEYTVEPTNLEQSQPESSDSSDDMPFWN